MERQLSLAAAADQMSKLKVFFIVSISESLYLRLLYPLQTVGSRINCFQVIPLRFGPSREGI